MSATAYAQLILRGLRHGWRHGAEESALSRSVDEVNLASLPSERIAQLCEGFKQADEDGCADQQD